MSDRGAAATDDVARQERDREVIAEAPKIALIALFVTGLLSGQVLATKVLGFALPVSLPVTGDAIVVPAGVLAYALTFFASDCLSELYGRRTAQVVVNVAFGMNFVLVALVWLAIEAPSARTLDIPAGVPPDAFATTLGFAPSIVLGSLSAYVVSQNWDVLAFHAIRERTGRGMLWLRNVGSTASSQLIDTVIFISVAFVLGPVLFGGDPSGLSTVASLIVGQYLVKLAIAALDTPLVYAVVELARSTRPGGRRFAPE